jgi:hypothetical protein
MKNEPQTVDQLATNLGNREADTIRLASEAVNIAAEIARLAFDCSPEAWERIESKAGRLERIVYRVKLDSRNHAIGLKG